MANTKAGLKIQKIRIIQKVLTLNLLQKEKGMGKEMGKEKNRISNFIFSI